MAIQKQELLKRLKDFGEKGTYRDSIRYYLVGTKTLKGYTLFDALIEVQFALALQHAGLFPLALNTYQQIKQKCKSIKMKKLRNSRIYLRDLLYNLDLQQAVLLERLFKFDSAFDILKRIGPPQTIHDIGIARASLQSWYSITLLKCMMSSGDYDAVKKHAKECAESEDWNAQIWGNFFLTLLELMQNKTKNKEKLQKVIYNMDRDPPGRIWLNLIAGQYLTEVSIAWGIEFLEIAERQATSLGKYFVIASASETLAKCYFQRDKKRLDTEKIFRRSLNAYSKCSILLSSPFKERLYQFAANTKIWSERELPNIFLHSMNLALDREDFVFSKMCEGLAQIEKKEPYQIFENFVFDWAMTRYSGTSRYLPESEVTADVIMICENKQRRGIIIQAKHCKNPRKSIPNKLYLRDLCTRYNLDEIEKYVFVLSTSHRDGWKEYMWNDQDQRKLENLIPDLKIKIETILEPDLQVDVVLNNHLYTKYFDTSYRNIFFSEP